MKKEFIMDDNEVRDCDYNVAKMNVFECFYYLGFDMFKGYISGLFDFWKEFCAFIFGFIILPISPIIIFIVCFRKIKNAKRDVSKLKFNNKDMERI